MTILLFDFDGTLADTLPTVIAIGNRLAPKYGYPPTTPAELEQLRHTSSRDILRSGRVERWKIPFLLWRLHRELSLELATVDWIADMAPVLSQLRQNGHLLGIITSNSARNVDQFVRDRPIMAPAIAPVTGLLAPDRPDPSCFTVIRAGITILGKQRVLKRLLRQYRWSPSQVLYVGDEVRDIEAARAAGVRSVAVTWGFNSVEALTAAQPDYVVQHPSELVAIARLSQG